MAKQTFTVIMKRTYETELKVEAKSAKEALKLAQEDETRFEKELNDCNVVNDVYFIEK